MINGIYDVEQMTVDGVAINTDNVKKNDSVLTRIYFETNNVCILQYNSVSRRVVTHYVYHEKSSQLQGIFDNPEKTSMDFTLTRMQHQYVGLDGTLSKAQVHLVLKKIE
ncbi:MAG: hypothetical protein QM802_18545 [Agriterribacter sp.]